MDQDIAYTDTYSVCEVLRMSSILFLWKQMISLLVELLHMSAQKYRLCISATKEYSSEYTWIIPHSIGYLLVGILADGTHVTSITLGLYSGHLTVCLAFLFNWIGQHPKMFIKVMKTVKSNQIHHLTCSLPSSVKANYIFVYYICSYNRFPKCLFLHWCYACYNYNSCYTKTLQMKY